MVYVQASIWESHLCFGPYFSNSSLYVFFHLEEADEAQREKATAKITK